jgi:hypothetical protein
MIISRKASLDATEIRRGRAELLYSQQHSAITHGHAAVTALQAARSCCRSPLMLMLKHAERSARLATKHASL